MKTMNWNYFARFGIYIILSCFLFILNIITSPIFLWSLFIISALFGFFIIHTFFKYVLYTKVENVNGQTIKRNNIIWIYYLRIVVVLTSFFPCWMTINILTYSGFLWSIIPIALSLIFLVIFLGIFKIVNIFVKKDLNML